MTDDYLQRFAGIGRLYGAQQLAHIRDMHVAVVGLGGVGSWAVEALARSGVGAITLIDFDTVAASNMNRQLPALDSTLGEKKHAVLAQRVHDINPDCSVTCIDDFINMDNLRDYLDPARGYSYVIDAIDSIKFKAAMIYSCKRSKIPIITTGAAGGLTDPTMIAVRDLNKTENDPLAARVRSTLRGQYGYTRNPGRYFGIECIYSLEQQRYPKEDGSVGFEKPGIHGVHLDCRLGYGAATFVTA
ncbi:MAG: tRNA threonylcarbamoyladenosine dehydratase, partial [Granulosicoccaceae bacterium]